MRRQGENKRRKRINNRNGQICPSVGKGKMKKKVLKCEK